MQQRPVALVEASFSLLQQCAEYLFSSIIGAVLYHSSTSLPSSMKIFLAGIHEPSGRSALDALLLDKRVTTVILLSSGATWDEEQVTESPNYAKVKVISVQDLASSSSYAAHTADLQGLDGCIWAFGITDKDLSDDEFKAVTNRYPITLIHFLASLEGTESKPCSFVYVTAEGAISEPSYATVGTGKVKHRTLLELVALSIKLKGKVPLYIARPSVLDTFQHQIIEIKEKSPTHPIVRRVFSPIVDDTSAPKKYTSVKKFGESLVELSMMRGEELPFEHFRKGKAKIEAPKVEATASS